jgi:hypothetical protein
MEFVALLALLAGPLVMGGMMVWMMRHGRMRAFGSDRAREDREP